MEPDLFSELYEDTPLEWVLWSPESQLWFRLLDDDALAAAYLAQCCLVRLWRKRADGRVLTNFKHITLRECAIEADPKSIPDFKRRWPLTMKF